LWFSFYRRPSFFCGKPLCTDNRNWKLQGQEHSFSYEPPNDAADVAAALKDVGYNVTLKTNIGLREMLTAVRDFTGDLRRSSDTEGFFWFAGHGLSIRGIHYLLPSDVDASDESIIARGSYAVDELMQEIEETRNRTNLIVIDACRNNFLPGAGSTRSTATRGLAVLSRDDYRIRGNKIIYSTMAGKTAADGLSGSRNSPFAQAFISKIGSPEIFDDVFLDIANETLRLTRGEQEPYSMGSFAVKSYSLNPRAPAAVSVAAAPAAPPSTSVETGTVRPAAPPPKPAREKSPSDLSLDGKKVFSFGVAPSIRPGTFNEGGMGVGLTVNFFEQYHNYGDFFFIPNSFFVSAEYLQDARNVKPTFKYNDGYIPNTGRQWLEGGIFGLGAQYKIRLGQTQRIITNFGVSFVVFTVKSDFVYDNGKEEKILNTIDAGFVPGFGVSGGLGFRFNRLLSLDLGMSYKLGFIGRDIKVYVEEEAREVIFAKKIMPYTIGGSLGATVWFPR